MSWRVIFLLLLVSAAAAAWGGLRLGEWLVAYGPTITINPDNAPLSTTTVLDADGKPFTAQPPQPLVDGRLAIPQPVDHVSWEIHDESLAESNNQQLIAIATTTITMSQAQQLSSPDGGQGTLVGIADVGDLIASLENTQGRTVPLQPIELPAQNTPVNSGQAIGNTNMAWQADLQKALQACNAENFFERPSCAWAARNQYCTPNNAWGRIPECPTRN